MKFPVTWVLMRLNGRKVYGGFCGKTHMLYHLDTSYLSPMIIHDLFVEDGKCEEGEGCLYQNCPLNRTTNVSYWKRHGIKGPPPKKPIGAFAEGIELPIDLREHDGKILMSKKHGPLLEIENRPGKTLEGK